MRNPTVEDDGRDPFSKASGEWLRAHPVYFVMLIVSCWGWSAVGAYILARAGSIYPTMYPFDRTGPERMEVCVMCYGFSVLVQGALSFLSDVFAPYYLEAGWDKRDNVFSYADIIMALINTGLGAVYMASCKVSDARSPALTAMAVIFVTTCGIFFPCSVMQFRNENYLAWVWCHFLWHLFPQLSACGAIYILST